MVILASMHAGAAGAERFAIDGDALCLDFANTLGGRPRRREERLHGYADLLAWAEQAGALDHAAARQLAAAAQRRPASARRALRRGLALRECLYRIFSARARGQAPAAVDLAILNRALHAALARLAVDGAGGAPRWSWTRAAEAFDAPLWPVARDAAELLVAGGAIRVQECGSEVCSWLFVDSSRGGRRRWCSMAACGNRAKARRFYRRRCEARRADPAAAPGGDRRRIARHGST